jgi:hypothetical protein
MAESESGTVLLDALKFAYQGMRERKDMSADAFTESIDPLLVGVSDEDRWALSNKLNAEYYRSRSEHPEEGRAYLLGLAWYLHSWSTGS